MHCSFQNDTAMFILLWPPRDKNPLIKTDEIQTRALIQGKTVNKIICMVLTHWGRDKMAAIFQTTFPNAFSWMKMFKFRLRFHWSLFPRVQLTVFQHWFRKWLGAGQATSHYLDQWWLIYWRMYASLGLIELICKMKIYNFPIMKRVHRSGANFIHTDEL